MKTLFTTIVLAAMAVPAFCADEPKPAERIYIQHFDTDKNGVMTQEEHQTGRKARFESMDKNKDGKLDREEFNGGHAGWHSKMNKKDDKTLEPGEYIAFFCGEEPKKDDSSKVKNASKYYFDCVAYRQAVFEVKDANKDGKVTEKEYSDSYATTFNKADKNKDGFIEIEEFYTFELELDAEHAAKLKECSKKGDCLSATKKPETPKAEAKKEPAPAKAK